jgi:hypothetical protein
LASLLSGLMAVVFAVALQRRLPPSRTGLAGCWAIALFGLGGIGDALMPMDCAPPWMPSADVWRNRAV